MIEKKVLEDFAKELENLSRWYGREDVTIRKNKLENLKSVRILSVDEKKELKRLEKMLENITNGAPCTIWEWLDDKEGFNLLLNNRGEYQGVFLSVVVSVGTDLRPIRIDTKSEGLSMILKDGITLNKSLHSRVIDMIDDYYHELYDFSVMEEFALGKNRID